METSVTNPGVVSPNGHGSKIRILFVDDEQPLLRVLRIGMRPMADEWDMHFAESGEAALDLIREKPFDVVVTDMRMPGINGAQLLNHVLQRHPQTVRIILSGYTDLKDVISCVGLTHQFLHKPCKLVDLRNSLQNVATLNRRLRHDDLLTLCGRLANVPSIPGLYFEMLQALQSPTTSTQRIAEIAAQDPALCAKLLQLSNSSFFGFGRTVTSVAEAVQLLGIGVIQSLALAMPLFSAFDRNKCPAFPLEQVWHHSVQTGLLGRRIAVEYLENELLGDQAFAAGVLHDIGQIILANGMSAEYQAIIQEAKAQGESFYLVERKRLHTTHAELGGYLLALWGLPFSLVDAVAYHHEPQRSQTVGFGLAGIIHIANTIQHEQAVHPDIISCPIDTDYIQDTGMAGHLEKWRAELVSTKVE